MTRDKKTLLITGGAGFIGSNFITYFLKAHDNYEIVNLDKLTYAGSLANLREAEGYHNYHFIEGDIADESVVEMVFADFDIDGIIHFAAESHVDKSIADTKPFITTNVVGTVNLLQTAKRDWEQKGVLAERRFHHISTDEVYGSLDEDGAFTEETPYDPRNPYSASKASANMLVKSYHNTYGMNVVISSSSNNYGPRQHDEKLIPTIIRNALAGESIPIYGDGQNIRDWLYVTDHCHALDAVFHHGNTGESYNIGGRNERTNLDMTNRICGLLDVYQPDRKKQLKLTNFKDLITFVDDRPGHDRRYAVDDSKIRQTLGWMPEVELDQGLAETVSWYINKWEQQVQ
ncbi:dTDP-glucose 4,6-dehydratase [Thalassobacillus cyri]|uniref:dTDP-glucose 4,6-dehydratase n=1 Tax=Thalassobacillus cyri TaxID=571932 RepID=A0A1H4H4X8_9BACI|nr:dTDP-glucose 4,6-dehydratase [Thalassobacillus cyri]SEB16420.1 dTDP-glucose 4,6-dehydratase [Thalassobacillus cyri]